MTWAWPAALYGLWAIPLLAGLVWASRRVARRALAALIGAESARAAMSRGRAFARTAMLLSATAAMIVALARPRWAIDPHAVTTRGRDICVVMDVSRSMSATDLAPNRLERSKLWVRDLLASLQGDRVALVAFAGSSVVKCPLTSDYGFFRLTLDELGPDSVSRGGTYIGDAIRKALDEVFVEEEARPRDILLITDGEDHESFPVEAAAQAGARGVRIIALGIGSDVTGAVVPGVRFQNAPVTSRLDARSLREVALATPGGAYLHVGTGSIDLDRVYQDLIASAEQIEQESRVAGRYYEAFPILIALAMGLLLVESLVGAIGKGVRRA